MSLNNSHGPSSSRTITTTNSDHQHIINDEGYNDENDDDFIDIHALTPPPPPAVPPPSNRRGTWDSMSVRSSNLSNASDVTNNSSENFTTMSREFNALVLAGSNLSHHGNDEYDGGNGNSNLDRIGEEEGEVEDTNPLAIVPDTNPLPSPRGGNSERSRSGISLGTVMGTSGNNNSVTGSSSSNDNSNSNIGSEIMVHRVKKEEVETKIMAWQNAKVAKINNRFKRDDAIIGGWENEQVQKATSWMKKVERKLEEKRAKAMEKMQNDIAKAHRKAEERRASAESKRGTKVAKVLEIANLMKAIGKPPTKRSFF